MESDTINKTKEEPVSATVRSFLSWIIFAFLIQCLISPSPASAQNDQTQKIKEGKRILESWIAARGGRERLSAIKDIKTTTEVKLIQQGSNMTLVTYKKGPGKYRQDQ